ncbi:DUF5320 domain-containing protein [Patescibacteria group bacterium]|nr:DUF5320 domain-containing protein [Patescibacteria group bacterium]
MPYFDGTGPMGHGPMTGRGMGPCGDGYAHGRGFGRGFGRGPGRGFGRRFFWQKPPTKEDQLEYLKDYKKMLEEEMKAVEEDLIELQK